MNIEGKHYAAGGGLLLGALLLADGQGLPTDLEEAQERLEENSGSVIDRVQEVSSDGELVIDPVSGVFYDDPEEGPMNDEEGDDSNVSFESVNNALAEIGSNLIDPTTYAPDTIEGVEAPEDGVLPDAGDSQVWGDAPEAEDDDLAEGMLDSFLSDEQKSRLDRWNNDDSTGSDTEDSGSSTPVTTVEEQEDWAFDGSSSSSDDDGGSSSSGSTSDSDPAEEVPVNNVGTEETWAWGDSAINSDDDDDSSDQNPDGDYDDDGEPLISLPDDVDQST